MKNRPFGLQLLRSLHPSPFQKILPACPPFRCAESKEPARAERVPLGTICWNGLGCRPHRLDSVPQLLSRPRGRSKAAVRRFDSNWLPLWPSHWDARAAALWTSLHRFAALKLNSRVCSPYDGNWLYILLLVFLRKTSSHVTIDKIRTKKHRRFVN